MGPELDARTLRLHNGRTLFHHETPSNFMATTLVRIDNTVYQQLLARKPEFLSATGFLSLTVRDALTAEGTLSLRGFENSERSEADPTEQKAVDVRPTVEPINKEKTSKPKKPKAIVPNADDVPEELNAHADLLLDYWAHRKGDAARTQRAWNSRMKEAAQILKDHGDETFLTHVNKAADAGWHGLHPEYIAQEKLAGETGAPESKHPAHKVFKASDLGPEWETPATNPALEGFF